MNEVHLDYSLYDSDWDLRYEKDLGEIRRECLRQRVFIERLNTEKHKAEFEVHLRKMHELHWSTLMWKLVKDFREGKQSKEDFLKEFDRIRGGMCSI